jgi:1-acyl-sn-glycerol-3-phosphate acyltransferase
VQNIIVEKPYQFIPPHRGDWIPLLIQRLHLVDWYLAKYEGITSHEVRHADRLRESLRLGHGIVLSPNHCRYADPLAMGWIAREVDRLVFSMASWHLFDQSRLQALGIRLCGGFSVYREGVDRQSLSTAIDVLVEAKRPLVVFPEGTVFRTNDILQPLLDGVAFLARTAARRREKHDGGKVVIHPVAIKYLFKGNLEQTVAPVLASIEERLILDRVGKSEHILDRIAKIKEAMLSLREIQYLGKAQTGSTEQRQSHLIEHLLCPLEVQWLGRQQQGTIMPRVKQLRSAIVPNLLEPKISTAARTEIWSDLADIYIAQQIASHPSDYLDQATNTRVLETIEALEEDLTDRSQVHPPLHAILEIGEAIEVESSKPPRGQEDWLMVELADRLRSMLAELAGEATPITRP